MGQTTCPSEGFDTNCKSVFPEEFVLLPFPHTLYWQPSRELSGQFPSSWVPRLAVTGSLLCVRPLLTDTVKAMQWPYFCLDWGSSHTQLSREEAVVLPQVEEIVQKLINWWGYSLRALQESFRTFESSN